MGRVMKAVMTLLAGGRWMAARSARPFAPGWRNAPAESGPNQNPGWFVYLAEGLVSLSPSSWGPQPSGWGLIFLRARLSRSTDARSRAPPRPIRGRHRACHHDQPNPRAGPRTGPRLLLRRRRRHGRLPGGLPRPEPAARPLRRGRHERRLRPDVHGAADAGRAGARLGARQLGVERAAAGHRRAGGGRCRLRAVARRPDRGRGLRAHPRQAGADGDTGARGPAVPDAGRGGGGADGHAQRARPLLRASGVAGDLQRRQHRPGSGPGAAGAVARRRPDHDRGRGDRGRRAGAGRDPVAATGPGGVPLPSHDRRPRREPAPGAAADGTRYHRPGGHPDQRLRQHRPGNRRGHRRGVVARLRVQAHVPADRAVRRLGGDGLDARGVAAGGRGRPRARARHGGTRHRADAAAQRAGDGRPDRAGRSDRPRHLRTGSFTAADTAATAAACGSTPPGCSATRSCASSRRPSTRSAAAGRR